MRNLGERIQRRPSPLYSIPSRPCVLPSRFKAAIASGVSSTRASFDKATEFTKANLETVEKIVAAAQTSSKVIAERVLGHAETNVNAAFEAAGKIARAKNFPELVHDAELLLKEVGLQAGRAEPGAFPAFCANRAADIHHSTRPWPRISASLKTTADGKYASA
jgi:hypothetical protein